MPTSPSASPDPEEIQKRQAAALAAIKESFSTSEDDDDEGAPTFVSHHLAELPTTYWQQHLQDPTPDPVRVLDLLILRSHWGDGEDPENGIDNFDFTLPGEVTDYVICVHFDEDGQIDNISMES